ncbi:MAG: phosphate ABC transporter permease subunit PstC, partial [Myxococcota bacterium]
MSETLSTDRGSAQRGVEACIHTLLALSAAISVLTTIGIVVILLVESQKLFAEVPPIDFLFGTRWSPLIKPQAFGILPLLCGTLLVTGGAIVVAAPLGLGAAIYLSEFASPGLRELVKPSLEVLAGIPSVVYGVLAVTTVSPIVRS